MAENLTVQTNQIQLGLDLFLKEQAFALVGVASVYHYEDGKRTSTLDGTRYTVADTKTFDRFDVKTPEKTPVVSAEQIASANERIYISFINAIVKPVKVEYGKLTVSVSADSAKVMRKQS